MRPCGQYKVTFCLTRGPAFRTMPLYDCGEAIGIAKCSRLHIAVVECWSIVTCPGPMKPCAEDVIPWVRPYFEFDEEGLKSITDVLASGQATNNGRYVREFETGLAGYLYVEETVVVSSGSDALMLAVMAHSFAHGKAILPAYTFLATLNAVVHAGLDPLFCDIEPGTFTMAPGHLRELLEKESDVRCVVPVNAFGVPPDLAAIRELCVGTGARLIYDNAHGFGTEVHGSRVAEEAEVQIFSFHATKILPAVEGGAIVSKAPALLSRARRLRNHGLSPNVADITTGMNAKMDEIRAVIGLHSLRHFPVTLEERRRHGHRILKAFQQFPDTYTPQNIPAHVASNFQNMSVRCPSATRIGLPKVMDRFQSHGIDVRSYFSPPLNKIRGFDAGPPLPVTESVWQTLISFPIHSRMSEEALCQVEEAIDKVAAELRSLD